MFLSLAIEPGVNRLARRGWRRGTATALILFGVVLVFLVFVAAIGTLVGSQIADLLTNSERYITDTVDSINDTFGTNLDAQEVIDDFNDPDGAVQQFIHDQQDDAVRCRSPPSAGCCSCSRCCCSRSTSSPTGRGCAGRSAAGSRRPARSVCCRRGSWRARRPAATCTPGPCWRCCRRCSTGSCSSRVGTAAPVALALWVGIVSQFLPVVGTYLAGVLPVRLTFLDSPLKALIVLIAIVVYQQIENYVFSPRITARTMELHPALAFGAALAGAAVLGAVGAVLALPAAAMAQALVSELGTRHEVVDSDLTTVVEPRRRRRLGYWFGIDDDQSPARRGWKRR